MNGGTARSDGNPVCTHTSSLLAAPRPLDRDSFVIDDTHPAARSRPQFIAPCRPAAGRALCRLVWWSVDRFDAVWQRRRLIEELSCRASTRARQHRRIDTIRSRGRQRGGGRQIGGSAHVSAQRVGEVSKFAEVEALIILRFEGTERAERPPSALLPRSEAHRGHQVCRAGLKSG